jgi:hypothetical protein
VGSHRPAAGLALQLSTRSHAERDLLVNVAISCLNIIAEHLKKAAFSVPYQEDSLAFLSRKTNEGILQLLQRIGNERILKDSSLLLFAITINAIRSTSRSPACAAKA